MAEEGEVLGEDAQHIRRLEETAFLFLQKHKNRNQNTLVRVCRGVFSSLRRRGRAVTETDS
jgi:hypothetical protein